MSQRDLPILRLPGEELYSSPVAAKSRFHFTVTTQFIPTDSGEAEGDRRGVKKVFRGFQTGGTQPSLFPRATYDSRGGYRINYQFIFKMLL